MNEQYIAGFDIGATNLRVALVNRDGTRTTFVKSEELLDTLHGPNRIAIQMSQMLIKLMSRVAIADSQLSAIGIGSTGPIKNGCLVKPTNLPFQNVPLVDPIQRQFRVPVALKGDCATAVLGEAYCGVGQKTRDKNSLHIAFVNIGTGIGLGVFAGGKLIEGKDGNAGEIGHLILEPNGLKCNCGNCGCAEVYASGIGIAKHARMQLINENFQSLIYELALQRYKEFSKSNLIEVSNPYAALKYVDASLVFNAAKQDDALALRLLHQATYYISRVLALVANLYNPEIITLGGQVILQNANMLLLGVIEMMRNNLRVDPPKIIVTPLGHDAGLLGALELTKMKI